MKRAPRQLKLACLIAGTSFYLSAHAASDCGPGQKPFPKVESAVAPVLDQLRNIPAVAPPKKNSNDVHFERLGLDRFRNDQHFLLSNTSAYSRLTVANDIAKTSLQVTLTCDQPFQLAPRSLDPKIEKRTFDGKKRASYHFTLKPKGEFNLLIGPATRDCQLAYSNKDDSHQTGGAQLKTESEAFPWLPGLMNHQEICSHVADASADHLDQFVQAKTLPQLSCPHSAENFETLETPESGFIAKTEMLLGQKLPLDFITKQDPYAPLDFSKAPKLKAIYLATLVYKADFYGTVMARLLKYHAEHGALVNVVTTGYMLSDKDKDLLRPIAAENGRFRLQEFKYYDPGNPLSKPLRYVDDKYRDMHIKLMVTLSDEKESDNAVVFGGRNIHDGFLFKTRPDYSKYPKLVQYGKEENFVHWNDFEMKVTSRELATAAASHLQRFLSRDTTTETMRDFTTDQPGRKPTAAGESTFRHFISLPYSDGHALEDLYVSMIDSASKSIRLSSPYLRPTPKILAALKRAAKRKVDISIQTRVELEGDTQAWLYEEVNKESINKLYQDVKIYRWKENSILHSKFLLVDGKAAIIGSVNLSRRSFIQDAENGFLIHSKPVVKKMETIFDSYVQKSERITKPEPRKAIPSLMIRLLENQF